MKTIQHSLMRAAMVALLFTLRPPTLDGQSPGATLEGNLESAPGITPAPEPPKPKERGVRVEPDHGSSPIPGEVRDQLTPEQIYRLELTRLQKSQPNHDDRVLVPIASFIMVLGILALVAWGKVRRRTMMHETVRLMLEKGQPIPAELLRDNFDRSPRLPKSDLRRGILWVAIGLGLMAFLLADHHHGWGLGFIPLCIGLGYLLAWKLEGSVISGHGA
jgi:Domain of unknown function (DUF6249)